MTAPPASDVKGSHSDEVHHPKHYNIHPSGIECVEFSELLPGNLSHVCVYVWRHSHKGTPEKDLRKALWFLDRELGRTASEKLHSQLHLGVARDLDEVPGNARVARVRIEDRLRGLQPFVTNREFVALVEHHLLHYDLAAAKALITHQLEALRAAAETCP